MNATFEPSTALASATLMFGLPSLSRIVPVAVVVVPSSALDEGPDSVTVKVSSSSMLPSSMVEMLMSALTCPAGMVSICADVGV